MVTDNCSISIKMLLLHPKQIKCQVCYSVYHMKCIGLYPDDHEHMRDNINTWYCSSCISQIFPLNTIEDGDILLCELNGISIDGHTIGSLVEYLFNPLYFHCNSHVISTSSKQKPENAFAYLSKFTIMMITPVLMIMTMARWIWNSKFV